MRKKTGKSLKTVLSKLISFNCALILLILFSAFVASAEDLNASDKMNTDAKISTTLSSKIAETSATEIIPVIVLLNNQKIQFNSFNGRNQIDKEQKDLINILTDAKSSKRVQKIKSLKIVNAVAVEVTPEVIASLSKRPDVSKIELDEIVHIAEGQELPLSVMKKPGIMKKDAWGVDKIEAPAVWQQGITGKGITVAVLDSGIDATHPDLDDLDDNRRTKDPKVVGWIDYVNVSATSPYDDNGHGTHVAGIISGTGAKGTHTGVAPGTNLIIAKVFDSNNLGYVSNVILAFEWAVNNSASVVSFSGGGSHASSYAIALDNAVAAGAIPVIAAGNQGPGASTINCPGDEINSTTVGATDSTDNIASFSSRGPDNFSGQSYTKPDLSAPGESIISTYPGGGYEVMSGTSMATPHVSGTVALMLQKNPALKPLEIKQILESTAVDLGPAGKDNTYGSGRIDAYNAVFYKQIFSVANFSSNVSTGSAPLSVQFNDISQGTPTQWLWDFDNNGVIDSTDRNPIYMYADPGNYTVNLTVKNAFGSNTAIKNNYIIVSAFNPPIADFSAYPTSGKASLTVKFTDNSTGSITSWYWNFGDKTTSTAKNPVHKYIKAGIYSVSLMARNATGTNNKTMIDYIKVTLRNDK